MPADFLSRSFQQTCAFSILDKDWVSVQQKVILCKFIKKSMENKWTYKFSMAIWYKKVEELAKEAVIRNNIFWIRRNNKFSAVRAIHLQTEIHDWHGDLMVGHDCVKKCKERLVECYFWPYIENDSKNTCRNISNAKCPKRQRLRKLWNCNPYHNAPCPTKESTRIFSAHVTHQMLATSTSSQWQTHSQNTQKLSQTKRWQL